MTTERDDEERQEGRADELFESFFDRDSGAWSLRRIPSEPPADPDQR